MTQAYLTCLLVLCTSLPELAFAEVSAVSTPTEKEEVERNPQELRWAEVFGYLSRLVETSRSEQELDAALSTISEEAELLGTASIDLLFQMAERRRDDLDPLSDVVISDTAEMLGRVAQERMSKSGDAGAASLAGLDAKIIYVERIEAWCAKSADCNLSDRRRYALALAQEMLARPVFWIEASRP